MREYLKVLDSSKPVVFCGDLNVAHLDLDIYNFDAKHIVKQSGCTPRERASFTELLSGDTFADAFRFLHPGKLRNLKVQLFNMYHKLQMQAVIIHTGVNVHLPEMLIKVSD